MATNQGVVGSNPAGRATHSRGCSDAAPFLLFFPGNNSAEKSQGAEAVPADGPFDVDAWRDVSAAAVWLESLPSPLLLEFAVLLGFVNTAGWRYWAGR